MALSLVGGVLQNQSTATSATLQIPSLTTGDLVVVFFECQSSTATITPHTGFVSRQSLTLTGTTQAGFWAWVADTTTTNFDVTFSISGGAVVLNMELWVWHSSVAAFTTSAIDKTNTNSGVSNSIATNSTGTLSSTSEVALAAAITATNNGGTEAIDSSFTIRSAATHNRCVLGDRIVTANTALNPTLSWSTSLTCAAMIVTFAEPTGSVALIINDSVHEPVADNLALTQHNVLAIAGATHQPVADNLTLSTGGSVALVIQDAVHQPVADSLTLTQHNVLAIADAVHAQTVDNVSFGLESDYVAVRVDHLTLVAATVATTTFTGPGNKVRVTNLTGGSEPIYFTVGTATSVPATPVVAADDVESVAAAAGASKVIHGLGSVTDTQVKLISAGTPTVTVELIGE